MAEEKVGFFKRLVNGLTKTRDSIVAGIDSIFSGYSNIDDDFYEEIEEILVKMCIRDRRCGNKHGWKYRFHGDEYSNRSYGNSGREMGSE